MPGSGPSYFSVTRKCWIDVVQRGPFGAGALGVERSAIQRPLGLLSDGLHACFRSGEPAQADFRSRAGPNGRSLLPELRRRYGDEEESIDTRPTGL